MISCAIPAAATWMLIAFLQDVFSTVGDIRAGGPFLGVLVFVFTAVPAALAVCVAQSLIAAGINALPLDVVFKIVIFCLVLGLVLYSNILGALNPKYGSYNWNLILSSIWFVIYFVNSDRWRTTAEKSGEGSHG